MKKLALLLCIVAALACLPSCCTVRPEARTAAVALAQSLPVIDAQVVAAPLTAEEKAAGVTAEEKERTLRALLKDATYNADRIRQEIER